MLFQVSLNNFYINFTSIETSNDPVVNSQNARGFFVMANVWTSQLDATRYMTVFIKKMKRTVF